ncbi:MAG: DNA topoisomerase IV subunit A, partial [Planctomycetota bacterium]
PSIAIPLRTLANVSFNRKKSILELGDEKQERIFFNVGMAKKFMQTFLVAAACKDLLNSGKTTSIRDLFYMTKHTIRGSDENTFDEQDESDPIIEDLEVTVDALREELHLFANRKGMMVGPITVVDTGDSIDLRRMGSGGWGIPSIVEKDVIKFRRCQARYVLFVEKGAVWSRLNEDKFWKKHKCLLLTSEGMPPRGVRRLLNRIDRELKLPIYVLVDNDPWGFYIYSVIKQGSINLAYESIRMAIPKVKFLGLASNDAQKYKLAKHVVINLNEKDKQRAKQLLDYPWFKKKGWQAEIRTMLKNGVKMELEALSSKGISFITDEYLPKKIRGRDWLD